MVTTATIEANSVAEAVAKVDALHKAFGNDVEIDLAILADNDLSEDAARLGYAFNWLKSQDDAIQFKIITDMKKMPQKAVVAVENAGLAGASYKPILFCGTQPVRGTNYLFIAEQTCSTNPPVKHVVGLKVNEYQGVFEIMKDSIKVIF